MGRPKIHDNPAARVQAYREKNARIEFTLDPDFKTHLEQLAKEGNMTLTEYIRGVLDYHTGFYRREL